MSREGTSSGWWVVAGSACGLATGSVVFFTSCFSLVTTVLARQYHWSQDSLAAAATIFLSLHLVMWPVAGLLVDRFGTRRTALGAIALLGLGLALLGQSRTLDAFYLSLAFLGLVGCPTNVVSYARALSLWFDRRRGLALGVAASGQAVGATLMPLMMQRVTAAAGLPTALLALGAIELLVCFPLVALLVKDAPPGGEPRPASDRSSAGPGSAGEDVPLSDVVRSAVFWKLSACFCIGALAFYAVSINIVTILQERAGMSLGAVASIQAATGLAVLFGRVGCGLLLDISPPALVASCNFALAAAGMSLYALSTWTPALVCAALLLGASAGAESDVMPYLATRFFGVRAGAKTFGLFLFAGGLGTVIAPSAFRVLQVMGGTVVAPLLTLVALQAVAIAIFLTLRSHRPHGLGTAVAGVPL